MLSSFELPISAGKKTKKKRKIGSRVPRALLWVSVYPPITSIPVADGKPTPEIGRHRTSTGACKAFLLSLQITYSDGTARTVDSSATDGKWEATTAANPIRYAHLYHGEQYVNYAARVCVGISGSGIVCVCVCMCGFLFCFF